MKEHFLRTLANRKYWFPCLLTVILALLTYFKISGTSIGMYNQLFYGKNYFDKKLVLGASRPIRSDEWLISTPLTISQSKNNFKHMNKFIGVGQEMSLLYDAPTNHWSTFFKPYNWSFFVLPLEQAFAMKWWVRGFLLLIGSYLLFLFLTKKNYLVATGLSLFIFFSPFYQWWYSNAATLETFSSAFFLLFFFIKIVNYKKIWELIVYGLFFVYFFVSFVIVLYPPFAFSLAWAMLFFLVGYSLNNAQKFDKKILLAFSFIIIFVGIILLEYYFSFKTVISIITNTVYPGQRRVGGGGYGLLHLLGGFYNMQLLRDNSPLPPFYGNQSEASNFIYFFPLILPFTAYSLLKDIFHKRKINYISLTLVIYFVLSLIWLFFGYPDVITKLFLLNKIPNNRFLIGLGLADVLLIVNFFTNIKIKNNIDFKITSFLISFTVFLVNLAIGFEFKFRFNYINNDLKIISISLISGVIAYLLLNQKKKLFLILLIFFSLISTYKVNPLYRGLGSIVDSPLIRELKIIDKEKKGKWLIFDNMYLGNYLAANGIYTLSGVHLYPQFEVWKKFDPANKYLSIYNRYSHVIFGKSEKNSIIFKQLNPDSFLVLVNPCNKIFNSLEVAYYMFPYEVKESSCLQQIKVISFPEIQLYIYRKSI